MRTGRIGKLLSVLFFAIIFLLSPISALLARESQQSTGTNQPPPDQSGKKKPEKPGQADKTKPKKTKPGPAIISGTVFRDPGLSFPGVEVTLQPDPEGKASNKPGKKMKTISDGRGEFSFRVPGVPMRYTVSVQAAGHQPEKSQVFINGEERQDVFFTLKPVPNPAANAPKE